MQGARVDTCAAGVAPTVLSLGGWPAVHTRVNIVALLHICIMYFCVTCL